MKHGISKYKGQIYEIKCKWKTSLFELSIANREGLPPRLVRLVEFLSSKNGNTMDLGNVTGKEKR